MEKTLTIEESLLRQVKKKKRKRRNKRIARFALLISLIVLVVFYLTSDMSKVKSLTVKNNIHYSDSQILELANIDYDSNYILTNSGCLVNRILGNIEKTGCFFTNCS